MSGINSSLLNLLSQSSGGQGLLQELTGKKGGPEATSLFGGETGASGEFAKLFSDIQSKLQSQLMSEEGLTGDLKQNLQQELKAFLGQNPNAQKAVDQLLQGLGENSLQAPTEGLKGSQDPLALLQSLSKDQKLSDSAQNLELQKLVSGKGESQGQKQALKQILGNKASKDMSLQQLEAKLKKIAQGSNAQKSQEAEALLSKLNKGQSQQKTAQNLQNLGQKLQGKGGQNFLQNVAMVNKNTAASVQKDSAGNTKVVPKKVSQKIQGYGKTQQQNQNSLFSLNPRMFDEKSQGELKEMEGLNLAKKNQDAQVQVSPKGMDGFHLDAQLSKEMAPQATMKANANTQVIDMRGADTSNKMEVINRIQNTIEQANIQRKDQVDLLVKHDELGNFRIQVNKKGAGRQVGMQIQTSTQQAHDFFSQHEADLMRALNKSGVKLADFQLLTGSSKEFSHVILNSAKGSTQYSQAEGQSSSKEGQFSQNSQGQHSSGEKGQREQAERDGQRRRQLWEEYREQVAA